MQWYEPPSSYEAAMERHAMEQGLVNKPTFPENQPWTWKRNPPVWTREPDPIPNKEVHISDIVVEDLLKRKQMGLAKYGVALQPNNGRDALKDAYEEALDLVNYLRQAMYERDSK